MDAFANENETVCATPDIRAGKPTNIVNNIKSAQFHLNGAEVARYIDASKLEHPPTEQMETLVILRYTQR